MQQRGPLWGMWFRVQAQPAKPLALAVNVSHAEDCNRWGERNDDTHLLSVSTAPRPDHSTWGLLCSGSAHNPALFTTLLRLLLLLLLLSLLLAEC